MKLKLILILFLFYSGLNFEPFQTSISIGKMKKNYSKGDPISIEIFNEGKKNVWIENIALEKKDSTGIWETVVPDVLSKNCGKPYGIQGFLMKSRKKFNWKWYPKSMNNNCFNFRYFVGIFRIGFSYGYNVDSINKRLYSDTFLIQ